MGWWCSGSVRTNPTSATEEMGYLVLRPRRRSWPRPPSNPAGSITVAYPFTFWAASRSGFCFKICLKLGGWRQSFEEHAHLTGALFGNSNRKEIGH